MITGPIRPKYYSDTLAPAPVTPSPVEYGEIVTDPKTARMWITGLNAANTASETRMVGPAAFYNSFLFGDSVIGFKEGAGSFSGGATLRLTQLVGSLPGLLSCEVPVNLTGSIGGSVSSVNLSSSSTMSLSAQSFALSTTMIGNDRFTVTADELVLRTASGATTDLYEISGSTLTGWTFFHKPLAGNYDTVANIDKDRIYHVGEVRSGTCQNAYLLKGDANGTIASTGLTNASAVLSVDASLTTSWSDVLTVSLAAGTWLVTGGISGSCNSSQNNFNARVYNNTAADFVVSGSMHVEHTGEPHGISMTGIVTVASTATISLGAKVDSGTGTAYAASEGLGSKSTTLVAVRIA